ncbi:MAG: MMPL family transporter [Thermomicrobiales bacterium]|nr:MMPL family transporter [Thermomicrobiales bacterium]MCO5228470.1 MMPL family transporter [Thermomicrobiales bacterium]
MFKRWAHIVITYPKLVIATSITVLLVAMVLMATITPVFDSEGYISDNAESMQVHQLLANQYGIGGDTLVMIFETEGAFTDSASLSAIDAAIAPLRQQPGIATVYTPAETMNPAMIANSGSSAIVIAPLVPGVELTSSELDHIREIVGNAAEEQGLQVKFGGAPFVYEDVTQSVEQGLVRAEMVAIPITLIVLVLVFGSVVSAAMPLLIGVASILTGMAVMSVWSTQAYQSVFATNMVTMLGLGLGIDYSLFMVTRYREELRHTSPDQALENTMITVGKAVFFSGITVMIGLGATMFFDLPALQSLGHAGMVVTASSMVFGLTLLPATLRLLGVRINAGRIGRKGGINSAGESAFWHRIANLVMKQPVGLLIACLTVLGVMALPAFGMTLSAGGAEVLPVGAESREVSERALTDFAGDSVDPIYVIVDTTNTETIAALTTQISEIDGVLDIRQIASESSTVLQVASAFNAVESGKIVNEIRALNTHSLQVRVGGTAAESLDNSNAIRDGLLPAALFVGIAGYLVLLLTFGSVLLPIKAMVMGVLSIIASMGVVVWVFQDGHLESLLNFSSSGMTVSMVPVLIACILFGLSMDYEVLLLSRIQEEYQASGDNSRAIAAGLAHTGQVVSGAATIMVIVFGGFVLADVLIVKSLGFGLAVAVLLDATLVRGVLVPSTMVLMGRWNWWAPSWIQRTVGKLGFQHTSTPLRLPQEELGTA